MTLEETVYEWNKTKGEKIEKEIEEIRKILWDIYMKLKNAVGLERLEVYLRELGKKKAFIYTPDGFVIKKDEEEILYEPKIDRRAFYREPKTEEGELVTENYITLKRNKDELEKMFEEALKKMINPE